MWEFLKSFAKEKLEHKTRAIPFQDLRWGKDYAFGINVTLQEGMNFPSPKWSVGCLKISEKIQIYIVSPIHSSFNWFLFAYSNFHIDTTEKFEPHEMGNICRKQQTFCIVL